jgi:2-hydroxychromene-2-carboxylate isomerase
VSTPSRSNKQAAIGSGSLTRARDALGSAATTARTLPALDGHGRYRHPDRSRHLGDTLVTDMELIVYGDFNCPYSCLASARVDALQRSGVDVEWRAVEHDPSVPVPSEPAVGEAAAMLDREVAEVSGLVREGERFPIRRPPVRANSAAAVAAFAALVDDHARQRFRRAVFEALWFDGRDIGDPAVLAELGAASEANAGGRAAAWQREWLAVDRRVVPLLVLPDGYVSRGLGALQRLADIGT